MLLEGEQKVLYQNSSGKVQEFDYGDGRIKASFCVVGGSFFFCTEAILPVRFA